MRILIADDDSLNLTITRTILLAQGFEVKEVRNGLEAYEAFLNERFQAILMDIEMPVLDGLKSIQRIREFERQNGGHVPIIAFTTHTRKEDREEYFRHGIDDYLSKPFKPFELSMVLRKVMVL
jgi:CheY-like chemotaxis protein